MVICHDLPVDCQPVLVGIRSQHAVLIIKEVVQAEINITVAVIIEHIFVQTVNELPLVIAECHGLLAGVLRPYQILRVKVIGGEILCRILFRERIVLHERGVVFVQAADALAAAQEAAQQRADHVGTAAAAALQHGIEQRAERACRVAAARRDLAAGLQRGKLLDARCVGGIHADLVIGAACGIDIGLPLIREVDGNAVCIGDIRGGAVILDRRTDRVSQLLALVIVHVQREVAEIDLVDLGGCRKLSCAVAGVRDRLIVLVRDKLADRLRKGGELRRHCIGKFRNVGHRERGLLAGAFLRTRTDELIDNALADLNRRHGGIRAECREPVGVVPADTRFGLLGSDHVVRIRVQHERGLGGCHQAGVEADEIKLHAAVLERLADAGKIHACGVRLLLIVAVAGDRSPAVIPEDQLIAVCREFLCAVLDKLAQRRRVGHGLVAHVLFQQQHLLVLDLIDLVVGAVDAVDLPLLAAAGIDDHIDVIRIGRGEDLLQVGGSHAALGFQVRTAHIDHDGDGIGLVAENLGVFIARTGRHRRIGGIGGRKRGIVAARVLRGRAGALDRIQESADAVRTAGVIGERTAAAALEQHIADHQQRNAAAAARCRTGSH